MTWLTLYIGIEVKKSGLGNKGFGGKRSQIPEVLGGGDCPMVVSFVLMAFAKAFMGVIDVW